MFKKTWEKLMHITHQQLVLHVFFILNQQVKHYYSELADVKKCLYWSQSLSVRSGVSGDSFCYSVRGFSVSSSWSDTYGNDSNDTLMKSVCLVTAYILNDAYGE